MSPPKDPLVISSKEGAFPTKEKGPAGEEDIKQPRKSILKDTTSIKTNETVFDLSLNSLSSSRTVTTTAKDDKSRLAEPPLLGKEKVIPGRTDKLDKLSEKSDSTVTSSTDSSPSTDSTLSIRQFAYVDSVMDFWMVDDELLGRFNIYSGKSTIPCCETKNEVIDYYDDEHPQFLHALIFKIKTTSPYNFWVKPIYGLMRPNTVATIEVRCEPKASRVKMELDEFVIEIAPVPRATAAMTCDLYTSSVESNLPELLSIWEKIEKDSQNLEEDANSNSNVFFKENHRVSLRFHRAQDNLLNAVTQIAQDKGKVTTLVEPLKNNNNLTKFSISTSFATEKCDGQECFLAREYFGEETDRTRKTKAPFSLSWRRFNREMLLPRNMDEFEETIVEVEQAQQRCCTVIRRLQFLVILLTLLLVGSLCYIYYSQYMYHHRDNWNGEENTHTRNDNPS